LIKNGNFYIYTSNSNSIATYNTYGALRFTFGGSTSTGENGKFGTIKSLTTANNSGNIVVYDSYNSFNGNNYYYYFRIQFFDTNGQFLYVYNLIPAIWNPSNVIMDGNNNIFTVSIENFYGYNSYGSLIASYSRPSQLSNSLRCGGIFQDNLYFTDSYYNFAGVFSTNGVFSSYTTSQNTTQYCF